MSASRDSHRRPLGRLASEAPGVGLHVPAVLLAKIVTLGDAVLAMAFFMVRDGQPVPPAQILIFGALTLIGAFLTALFLRFPRARSHL